MLQPIANQTAFHGALLGSRIESRRGRGSHDSVNSWLGERIMQISIYSAGIRREAFVIQNDAIEIIPALFGSTSVPSFHRTFRRKPARRSVPSR